MEFVGIDKFSLLDYEEKVSIVLFSPACNFRCPFCHNGDSVLHSNTPILFKDILAYLKTRVGLIDAVVFTGGEPTMMPDLFEKIQEVKNMGFSIKLDTNGTNLEVVRKLVDNNLLDYIAMDVKNSLDKYAVTTGAKNVDLNMIKSSIEYIKNCGVDYEFRTTLINEFHSLETIKELGKFIKGAKKYRLQKFTDSDTCIQRGLHPVSKENALQMKDVLLTYINDVELRSY